MHLFSSSTLFSAIERVVVLFILSGMMDAHHTAAQSRTLEAMSWLSGCWRTASGDAVTDELWTTPSGGALLGLSRTIQDGKTLWYEFLQIRQQGDSILYVARPSEQPEAAFLLTARTDSTLLFENPAHDFPRLILYVRISPDTLLARIEGREDGMPRVAELRYGRTPCVP